MIVSAGITEHIEGLSQLIRWQDVTTSTLKNSQKTVKKSQKGTIQGDQTCTRTLLFLQESLSTLSRGLFQLIRVARRLQISVRSDLPNQGLSEPDLTRPNQTGPDWTGPDQKYQIDDGSNVNADIVVSARFMEHIEGLSQLIRWQDFITSSASVKTLRRTVTKSPEKEFQNDWIHFFIKKIIFDN